MPYAPRCTKTLNVGTIICCELLEDHDFPCIYHGEAHDKHGRPAGKYVIRWNFKLSLREEH